MSTLRESLRYEPRELRFGTSGRRGEVVHLTQLEIYLNVRAELQFLQSLPVVDGGIRRGEEFYFARDLRPSSDTFVAAQGGRGEIAQAVVRAAADAGFRPINLGQIPTPALANYAYARQRGSIMVTGSHIPFDRNGYKANTCNGELLKEHEAPIQAVVAQWRERLYSQPEEESPFDAQGNFKSGHAELPPASKDAAFEYIQRYVSFFGAQALRGLRLLVYQHSAVGRDLLVELLRGLGAEVTAAGRSDTFVPIDTENIGSDELAVIQELATAAKGIDAVVSTDGDSDRPLLLGVDRATGAARFFGGDLLGMVAAQALGADAVVVPVSTNDAIDRGGLAGVLEAKTRIGSPYVIAGMQAARRKGRRVVCGWEANGGFLTGSDVIRGDRVLKALPTRDAVLPIAAALVAARARGVPLAALFDELPRRYSRAALLPQFPRPVAQRIIDRCSQPDAAAFLAAIFTAAEGFSPIAHFDYTDGVRITFENGEVAHLRPSGNADEFRIYAVADTQARADEICRLGVARPEGILLRLASACFRPAEPAS